MKLRTIARQRGFTLVEIAIVLVIIGVLLVGVLQGQEMIDNSKTKSIVNDIKSIQTAYNAYIDRYRNLPGDETTVTMAARGWTGPAAATGNANGILEITLADTFLLTSGESQAFWRAMRGSGLLSGDPAAVGVAALPRHSAGGLLGATTGSAAAGNSTVYGQFGLHVCAGGLSSKQAASIDTAIDGPLPANNVGANIGRVRAATGAANPLTPVAGAPAGTAYSDATQTPWTVCVKIS